MTRREFITPSHIGYGAAQLLGVNRQTVYDAMGRGEVPNCGIGSACQRGFS